MNKSKTGRLKASFESSTFIVALFTLIGYLGAYIYYFSYYDYFSIPFILVELSLLDLLYFVLIFSLSAFIFILFIDFFYSKIVKRVGLHNIAINGCIMLACTVLAVIWGLNIHSLTSILVSLFFFLGSVWIVHKSWKPFDDSKELEGKDLERFEKYLRRSRDGSLSLTELILERLNPLFLEVPLLILFTFIAAFCSGGIRAKLQEHFLVNSCYDNKIVFNISENFFALVAYKSDSRVLEEEVSLINKSDISQNCKFGNKKVEVTKNIKENNLGEKVDRFLKNQLASGKQSLLQKISGYKEKAENELPNK